MSEPHDEPEYHNHWETVAEKIDGMQAEIERLSAENERLRNAKWVNLADREPEYADKTEVFARYNLGEGFMKDVIYIDEDGNLFSYVGDEMMLVCNEDRWEWLDD